MNLDYHYLDRIDHRIREYWGSGRVNNVILEIGKGTKCGVYFLAGEFIVEKERIFLVKIGHAQNVSDRCRQIRKNIPNDLSLVHFQPAFPKSEAATAEKHYHHLFCDYRVRGEWFHLEPVVKGLTQDGETPFGLTWEQIIG